MIKIDVTYYDTIYYNSKEISNEEKVLEGHKELLGFILGLLAELDGTVDAHFEDMIVISYFDGNPKEVVIRIKEDS